MALFTTKTYFEWRVVAQIYFKLIESIYIVDGYSKTKGFSIFQYVWMSFDVRLRTIDPFLHTLISFINLRDRIPFEFNFWYKYFAYLREGLTFHWFGPWYTILTNSDELAG